MRHNTETINSQPSLFPRQIAVVGLFFATMAACFMGLSIMANSVHAAGYNFDPSCSATNTEDISEPSDPNAMMMLDKSGSMGWSHFYPQESGTNLWDVAVEAIDNAGSSLQDEIRLGLGYFPDRQCSWTCWWFWCWYTCSSTGANIVEASAPNNHSTIMSHLNSDSPTGGTPTDEGIRVTAESASMNDPDRASGGLIITDGYPNNASSAINEACSARDDDQLMYAVGLGGATDQDFNNELAAAMGTGCCGAGCDPDEGVGQDPCSTNVNNSNCKGAYQAYDPQEFENVLLNIGEEISCTFGVDTSLHDEGEAPDDPDALQVQWTQYGVTDDIPHRSESGEGWYFPSGDSRDQISLTTSYCNDIRGGNGVDEVTTQLACDCQVEEGDGCQAVPDGEQPDFGECPDGQYTCDSGYGVCEPLPLYECPVECPGMEDVMGEPCHIDNEGDITESGPPMSPNDPSTETNRCKVGEVQCSGDGTEPVCAEVHNPMPELCDGLDNSCDGSINNINQTWNDWYDGEGQFEDGGAQGDPDLQPLGEDEEAAACWERDECLCDNFGDAEHAGRGATEAEEFEAYMSAWDDYPEGCYCEVNMSR